MFYAVWSSSRRCLHLDPHHKRTMILAKYVRGTTVPTVNVHQAKTQLSRLLALAEGGEEVVIARRGEPVARLVACKPKSKRRFGAMKGQIVVDDGILDPLPEEELARWEGKSE